MLNPPEAALESYDKAISLQPGNAQAHYNRGVVLAKLQRLDAAVASYDKAISIRPDHAGAWYNRRVALKELKQLQAAMSSYDRAIAIKPDYAEAHNNRGNALQELKQFDAALATLAGLVPSTGQIEPRASAHLHPTRRATDFTGAPVFVITPGRTAGS